ncbi:MAG: SIMPL domain-containing protein [Flavobacteriaceae bacterium]|nr:SIMPL domain-containing protein [Flavobacteriaceae bacterium]
MKKLVLIFIFALVQNVVLAQKNFLDLPYIETSAKADTLVTPDHIYLSININEADSRNKKSVEQQESEMERVLKSLNINTERNLMLSDLSSNFKNYFLKGQNILKSKHYQLLLHDATTAGKVIVALENIGISNVRIEKTEYSKAEELLLDLKSQAIAKTKNMAEKLVKPLNQKIGKAIHISENANDYNTRNYSYEIVAYAKTKSEKPIDIEFKKIKLEARIFVKYILE